MKTLGFLVAALAAHANATALPQIFREDVHRIPRTTLITTPAASTVTPAATATAHLDGKKGGWELWWNEYLTVNSPFRSTHGQALSQKDLLASPTMYTTLG